MKTAYKIECEWDVGLGDVIYHSKEAAMLELQSIDWEGLLEDTLEGLMDDGYVTIKPVNIK
jgi:hypothetical protein